MLIILRSLGGKYSLCNRFLREDGFDGSIRSPYFVVGLFVFSLNLAEGGEINTKMVPRQFLSLSIDFCFCLKHEKGLEVT